MKKVTVSFVFLCFAVAIAGCTQKQVRVPPAAQVRQPQAQSPITVQPLDDPGAERGSVKRPTVVSPPEMTGGASSRGQDAMMPSSPVLPSIDYVNDRVFEYGRKLERWKELDRQSVVMNLDQEQTEAMVRCFRDLQKVMNGYGRLHDDLLQRNIISESSRFDTGAALDLQKMDIAFLESECGRLLGGTEDQSAGWQERQQGADLSQIETLIERYDANKEYDEVVQVWLQIPQSQVERVDLRTKIIYGNALMYLDQQEEAAEVYRQIVEQMSASEEQPMDLLSLRKVLADLYTASGNYPAAEGQYDLISSDYLAIGKIDEWAKLQLSILERSTTGSPELTEFSQLLRSYLGFRPERDGYRIVWQSEQFLQNYPYSPVASNVDLIKENAQKRADEWFAGFMTGVDDLAGEKKYQDAMELLEDIPEDIIGPDKVQVVKSRTDELVLAEAVERETIKVAQMQELQRRWNEGMVLADRDEYDEAIQVFTELLDTEYSDKARIKIEELAQQAAKDERRKAADLFIRFTKTDDIDSKKKLLVESRRVLKDILVKYPEVDIADKVVGNINRVEKEMNDLDPTLLPAIEREERQAAGDGQGAGQPAPPSLDPFDLPLPSAAEGTTIPDNPEPAAPATSRPVPLPVLTQ